MNETENFFLKLDQSCLRNSIQKRIQAVNYQIITKNYYLHLAMYFIIHKTNRKINFDLPIEILDQTKMKNPTQIYQRFKNEFIELSQNGILDSISDPNFFWLVTFPNIFGSFSSEESAINGSDFLFSLFSFYITDNKPILKKDTFSVAERISLAVISYIMSNAQFIHSIFKNFPLSNNSIMESLCSSIKYLNIFQIQVLKTFFKFEFQDQKQFKCFITFFLIPLYCLIQNPIETNDPFLNLLKELSNSHKQERITNFFNEFLDKLDNAEDYQNLISYENNLNGTTYDCLLTQADIKILENILNGSQTTKITEDDMYLYVVFDIESNDCNQSQFNPEKNTQTINCIKASYEKQVEDFSELIRSSFSYLFSDLQVNEKLSKFVQKRNMFSDFKTQFLSDIENGKYFLSELIPGQLKLRCQNSSENEYQSFEINQFPEDVKQIFISSEPQIDVSLKPMSLNSNQDNMSCEAFYQLILANSVDDKYDEFSAIKAEILKVNTKIERALKNLYLFYDILIKYPSNVIIQLNHDQQEDNNQSPMLSNSTLQGVTEPLVNLLLTFLQQIHLHSNSPLSFKIDIYRLECSAREINKLFSLVRKFDPDNFVRNQYSILQEAISQSNNQTITLKIFLKILKSSTLNKYPELSKFADLFSIIIYK